MSTPTPTTPHDVRRPARRATLVPALVLIGLLTTVVSIEAYVLFGESWPTGSTSYRINPNFPGGAAGTTTQQVEAIRCGAQPWMSQAQSGMNLNYAGTTTVANTNGNDGVNAAYFSPANPGGGTLAVTTTFFNPINSTLTAFDMAFFDTNDFGPINWNGVGDSAFNQTDLIAVATHEFGHAIGIDHTPIASATMFASYVDGSEAERTLHVDDIDAVQFLYGVDAGENPNPQINDVDPPDGPTTGGNQVTITGANFTWKADTTVRIDNVVLSPAFWELENCGSLIITSMPAHAAGSVPIRIDNELGTVTLNNAYTYGGAPPTLTAVSPASGPVAGGNQVSILGTNLDPAASVLFGASLATSVTAVSANELVVTVPAAASGGVVDVAVSQNSGGAVLNGAYTYSTNLARVQSVQAPIGGAVTSQVLATTDLDILGYSLVATFDGTALAVADVTLDATVAAAAEFFQPGWDNTGTASGSYWLAGVIMALNGSSLIPAGNEFPILTITYDVDPGQIPGTFTLVTLTPGAGFPPTDIVFSPPSGVSITPQLVDAIFTFIDTAFIRGDANLDGGIDIADAIAILGFLFTQGPGPCADALDANDDGGVNIADAVYVLNFLFTQGTPPPAPHPNPGTDPTPDALGC